MALPLDTLDIAEIVRPIDSGMTRPFLCRLADGHLYAVKGRAALNRGLVAEVVAGRLGRMFGLPIPPFAIGHMPRALLHHHGDADAARAIGEGLAFASAWQDSLQPVTPLTLTRQDQTLLARLYVFDHWIANGDRTLTEHGGNPNLFVRLPDGVPVVIDHNLAFAADYDPATELPLHAGRAAWRDAPDGAALAAAMRPVMNEARALLPRIIDTLPEAWLDDDVDIVRSIAARLDRCALPAFWTELA